MADSNVIILAAGTTDSVVTQTINVKSVPVRVSLFGTVGSDTADLQVLSTNSPQEWDDVYDSDGQVQLSATRPQVEITGSGQYRLNIATRTGSWGASASLYDTTGY